MKKGWIISIVVLVLGAFALADVVPQENSEDAKVEKDMCLACHGSFDEIAAKTADYTAPSGETVTPHRYVPHAEKEFIPECVECHQPHPIPLESKQQVVRPEKIDWCYESCHHAQTLDPCSACH